MLADPKEALKLGWPFRIVHNWGKGQAGFYTPHWLFIRHRLLWEKECNNGRCLSSTKGNSQQETQVTANAPICCENESGRRYLAVNHSSYCTDLACTCQISVLSILLFFLLHFNILCILFIYFITWFLAYSGFLKKKNLGGKVMYFLKECNPREQSQVIGKSNWDTRESQPQESWLNSKHAKLIFQSLETILQKTM